MAVLKLTNPTHPYPFPTAWPGSGVSIANTRTGQKASDPDRLTQLRAKPRNARKDHSLHQYWQAIDNYFNNTDQPTLTQRYRSQQSVFAHTWKESLTTPQRAAWTALASSVQVPNYYGTKKTLSGWGFFLRANRMYTPILNNFDWQLTPPYDPLLLTPPPAWPTLPTPNIPHFVTYQWHTDFPPAIIFWTDDIPLDPTGNTWYICYISHYGNTITKPRQGQLSPDGTIHLPTEHSIPQINGGKLYNHTMPEGTLITWALRTLNTASLGESPLIYITQPIAWYP